MDAKADEPRLTLDGEELPEVYEGLLDGALFEAYMGDLATVATLHSVRIRSSASERADEHEINLDQARLLLVLGSVAGVQIRYEHEKIAWVDTLMRGPGAIRLVRMKAPIQVAKRRLRVVTD